MQYKLAVRVVLPAMSILCTELTFQSTNWKDVFWDCVKSSFQCWDQTQNKHEEGFDLTTHNTELKPEEGDKITVLCGLYVVTWELFMPLMIAFAFPLLSVCMYVCNIPNWDYLLLFVLQSVLLSGSGVKIKRVLDVITLPCRLSIIRW